MRKLKQRWVKSRRRWSKRCNVESVRLLPKDRWGTSERSHSGLTFPTTCSIFSFPFSYICATLHVVAYLCYLEFGGAWFRELGLFDNNMSLSRARESIHCQTPIPSVTSLPQNPYFFLILAQAEMLSEFKEKWLPLWFIGQKQTETRDQELKAEGS